MSGISYGENDDIQIKGGTDGTIIGNTGSRLNVDAAFSTPPTVVVSVAGNKTRVVDMNASSGGVARGTTISSTTTYTTLFNYNGSGRVFSFLVTFEGNLIGADSFNIKFEIDSTTVFEITTDDVGTNILYNLTTAQDESSMGLSLNTNVLRFSCPKGLPLTYSSNVKVSIKKATSTAAKAFRAGMIYLTKET